MPHAVTFIWLADDWFIMNFVYKDVSKNLLLSLMASLIVSASSVVVSSVVGDLTSSRSPWFESRFGLFFFSISAASRSARRPLDKLSRLPTSGLSFESAVSWKWTRGRVSSQSWNRFDQTILQMNKYTNVLIANVPMANVPLANVPRANVATENVLMENLVEHNVCLKKTQHF